MKRSRDLLLLTALLGILTFGLTGCSDDDDDDGPVNPPASDAAMLRVVHASPDAPLVDIYVDGGDTPVITALGYGAASDYLEVDPGTYSVEIRGHGADPTSTPAFTVDALDLAAGARVTAVAAGLLGSSDPEASFRVLPYVEDFADPGTGNAAVRIVHAAPDAPTVALDVGNDGAPEVTDFARFAETGAAGVALPAGTAVRIGVWAGSPLARAAVFTTPALPEGGELFVVATGLLAADPQSNGFSLLAVAPDGAIGFIRQDPPAVVHALHASPDAPAVDIDAGGSEVVSGLDFGQLSGELAVLPGAWQLDFRAAGTQDVAASQTTPYLEPGQHYLAIATGFLGGDTPAFTLVPVAEEFTGEATDALVRVVHASPDAPAVDVGPVTGGAVAPVADFRDLAFGDSSAAAGTVLPAGSLTIGVAATGTTTPVASFAVEITEGLRAFAVACGSLDGPGESFRLALVVPGDPWAVVEVLPQTR